jgi:hypothetical protein
MTTYDYFAIGFSIAMLVAFNVALWWGAYRPARLRPAERVVRQVWSRLKPKSAGRAERDRG